MSATEVRLKEMILAGDTLPDFEWEFPNLERMSLNTMASRVRKKLTPEETQQAEQAKRSKGKNRRFKKPPTYSSLSGYHARVGSRLYSFRNSKKLEIVDFCAKYKFGNKNNFSDMQSGLYNFNLEDLIRLADIIEISVEELISPLTTKGRDDASR